MIERIVSLLIGYLIGNIFQTGFWIGKFNHIDIRDYGSGNAGTTNVLRTLGKKAGIITYIVDTFKSILAAIIIHFIFGKTSDCEILLFLYTGLGSVLGHNFPVYLKFKGGKGIAASSGVVLSLFFFPKHCWILSLLGFIAFTMGTIISKYVSFGSLLFLGLFFFEFLGMGLLGWIPLTGGQLIEAYIIVFILSGLAFIRHRTNIQRLINGTERKIGQKKVEVNNG